MSKLDQVLNIARQQADAVASGDLEAATAMLEERGTLLRAALPGKVKPADAEVIREILRLDRALSGAIRERMVEIRDEVTEGRRGRRALDRYGHAPQGRPLRFDGVG
jgi:hypothetical protein